MNGANPSSKDNLTIKVVALFSLAIIAFYLITEHRAHILAYSSYIIFFVFILMHLFMHSGHGGHKGHGGCGGGHRGHGQEKHEHEAKEQKRNGQGTGEQQDLGQHEHGKENFT